MTDEMRAYAEAAYQAGWRAAVAAASGGSINCRHAEEWFEQNPPESAYEANRTDVEELLEALEEARKIIGLVEHDWIVPKERLNKALTHISSLEKKGS